MRMLILSSHRVPSFARLSPLAMRPLPLVAVIAACALLACSLQPVAADTTANCTYSDFIGHWAVLVSSTVGDKTINCTTTPTTSPSVGLTLAYPNIAKDDQGNVGNWTLIYNQGFEAWINGQIYFAFSGYTATTSLCEQTQIGWVHNQAGQNWQCFSATRDATVEEEVVISEVDTTSPMLPSAGPLNILDFGAVANTNTDEAAEANSAAIVAAFAQATENSRKLGVEMPDFWAAVHGFSSASYSDAGVDSRALPIQYDDSQTVLIPADSTFYISYTRIQNASMVLLAINGTLVLNGNETRWQELAPAGYYGALHFFLSQGVTVQGKQQTYDEESAAEVSEKLLSEENRANGWNSAAAAANSRKTGSPLPTSAVDIDGVGYNWWWTVILGPLDHRPHMFYFQRCTQFVVQSLYVQNAPMFHFLIEDSADFYYKNLTIYVDIHQQKTMTQSAIELGLIEHPQAEFDEQGLQISLPVFPLNTDGVDPSVNGLLMEDFYIENYDDAVAVKPANGENSITTCAKSMLIRNGAVKYSVGLTIGSVPPHLGDNCVWNITFTDITMTTPFKAIYIKTNPGTEGTGSISYITYNEITILTPLWYPIWIGPQQQKQPANGTDTGCSFFYPLNQVSRV
jgi:hypothetical protein